MIPLLTDFWNHEINMFIPFQLFSSMYIPRYLATETFCKGSLLIWILRFGILAKDWYVPIHANSHLWALRMSLPMIKIWFTFAQIISQVLNNSHVCSHFRVQCHLHTLNSNMSNLDKIKTELTLTCYLCQIYSTGASTLGVRGQLVYIYITTLIQHANCRSPCDI